jgi:hypothetical protein
MEPIDRVTSDAIDDWVNEDIKKAMASTLPASSRE